MSNHVVSKTRCPKCAKLGNDKPGDNLAIYSDGHEFCYSCGYVHTNLYDRIQNIGIRNSIQLTKPIQLPKDIDIDYPAKAIEWVSLYDLTIEDLHNHNFLWSEYYQRLIYPVWQGEQVVFWTGRYFGTGNSPKWLNKGSPKELIHCLNHNANKIVIVEDIISGIKITKCSKDYCALVLFNSHNPVSKLKTFLKSKKFYLWLDNDKIRESIFFTKEAVGQGLDIKTVRTDKDPKECSFKLINEVLNG